MFVKKINFFILTIIYTFISTQGTDSPTSAPTTTPSEQPSGLTPEQVIKACQQMCMPIPQCIDMQLFDRIPGYNCRSLAPYPNSRNISMKCCEIEFKEEENATAPTRHGCLAILPNYIDNDRYEDIIDWIERGKADKIEEYTVFLGKTAHDAFLGFIKNETDYEVYKLDCLTKYLTFTKFFILSILAVVLL